MRISDEKQFACFLHDSALITQHSAAFCVYIPWIHKQKKTSPEKDKNKNKIILFYLSCLWSSECSWHGGGSSREQYWRVHEHNPKLQS